MGRKGASRRAPTRRPATFTSDHHAALPHNAAMKTGSVPHPLSDSVIFTSDHHAAQPHNAAMKAGSVVWQRSLLVFVLASTSSASVRWLSLSKPTLIP